MHRLFDLRHLNDRLLSPDLLSRMATELPKIKAETQISFQSIFTHFTDSEKLGPVIKIG